MTKRINWDQVSRQQKGRRHGTSSAYDELPPVGSWADQQRIASRKMSKRKATALRTKTKAALTKVSQPRPLAACQICGNLVGKMERHIRRAHGTTPGYEHEAPITLSLNDEVATAVLPSSPGCSSVWCTLCLTNLLATSKVIIAHFCESHGRVPTSNEIQKVLANTTGKKFRNKRKKRKVRGMPSDKFSTKT